MTRSKMILTLAVIGAASVLLVPTRETQAGGWSVSIGGISFGSSGHDRYGSTSYHHGRRHYRSRSYHHGRRHYRSRSYYRGHRRSYRRGPVVQDITPYYGHPPVYAVQPYRGHPTVIVSPGRRYRGHGRCR